MNVRRRYHAVLIASLLALLLMPLQHSAAAEPQKAWAYVGWWLPDSWRNAPIDRLDRLLFFELKVNTNGEISERNGWPEKWGDLRHAVNRRGIPLDLTLTLFDAAQFDALFSSADATRRLLNEASALTNDDSVAGLQIDFEIYTAIRPAALDAYRQFVRDLSSRLHKQVPRRNLSVFFPIGGESPLYDAKSLAQVDQVVLQGYDAHWPGSKVAGPVAPLKGGEPVTWEKAVALGMSLGIPKNRLMLGFPLFGYEWRVNSNQLRSTTIGQAATISFAPIPTGLMPEIVDNAQERGKQYGVFHDRDSGSSYYQFKHADGKFVEGWFEDQLSLERKSDFLVKHQLGGIAFFMLGYDNSNLVNFYLRRQIRRISSVTKMRSNLSLWHKKRIE